MLDKEVSVKGSFMGDPVQVKPTGLLCTLSCVFTIAATLSITVMEVHLNEANKLKREQLKLEQKRYSLDSARFVQDSMKFMHEMKEKQK